MPTPLPPGLDNFFIAMSFVLGAMIGSFLNVCIYRLPADLSIVKPASRCPKCEKPIAWYDNIPILSWLILRAKCRNCGVHISARYPAIEFLTGVMFLLVYLKFGAVIATPIYMILVAALIVVIFVDLDHWIIPDEISLTGIPIGIGCAVLAMLVGGTGLRMEDPLYAILGAVAGGGFLYLLDLATLVLLKKPGMGLGDVKLLAMLGAFFGVKGVVVTIVLGSIAGSAVGIPLILWARMRGAGASEDSESPPPPDDEHEPTVEGHYLPFGPFLVLGGIGYMFFGPELVDAYINFIAPAP